MAGVVVTDASSRLSGATPANWVVEFVGDRRAAVAIHSAAFIHSRAFPTPGCG